MPQVSIAGQNLLINFPDEMTSEDIKGVLAKKFPKDSYPPQEDKGLAQKMSQGYGQIYGEPKNIPSLVGKALTTGGPETFQEGAQYITEALRGGGAIGPGVALNTKVFKAMSQINPRAEQGSLIYIPELRNALKDAYPTKELFDKAVMKLAKDEKVQLQRHSRPSDLTPIEKEQMIYGGKDSNGYDRYLMAIGKRME
jgi:hypothetical protein